MNAQNLNLRGLWLPTVTPFLDDAVDFVSLRRLVRHYRAKPIDGFVLAGTTGEALTLSFSEKDEIVQAVAGEQSKIGNPIPVLLGMGGSDTKKLTEDIRKTLDWPTDGYLISTPAYSRPSQVGLALHFEAMADATARPLVLYNIPYRTGVNLANDTLLRLAEARNIVGVKDCSADPDQSLDLLMRRPASFSVMTGEDLGYFGALSAGADGAILASAHVVTEDFAKLREFLREGRLSEARALWYHLRDITKLLFNEPSPGAIKHWLWRSGLINSRELRLPMTPISDVLAERIDGVAMP